MDTRFVSIFILLITLASSANAQFEPTLIVNDSTAGNDVADQMPAQSQDPTCISCLEASRKAEEALGDNEVFDDLEMLSIEVCHVLPSDIRVMCLEKSGDFIYQTKSLLQDLFHEKSLCSNTGLCIGESAFRTSVTNLSPESDDENCVECRRAIKDIVEGLKATRSQKKIINALIVHCEEAGESEKPCKQRINSFVPMIMGELEGYTPSELCVMLSYCTGTL